MFEKISEQPSLYSDLEKKSVREILEDINAEDQKVAIAVQNKFVLCYVLHLLMLY